MTAKKALAKRGGKQAVKRGNSRRKAVGHSATKKSSGKSSAFAKASQGTVIVGSKSKPGALAVLALNVFTEGVQDALQRLAELNIPAVVRRNGRRIEAVPTKVRGRYVVADPQEMKAEHRSTGARKNAVRGA